MTDPGETRFDARRDPTRLVLALATGGVLWFAFGRVTVVPFLEDERRKEAVLTVWREATRQLPETAFPSVMAVAFWLCAAGVLVGSVALAAIVGRVDASAGVGFTPFPADDQAVGPEA